MSQTLDTLHTFSAAEEFLNFLNVDFNPQVVHVNRLHILKRFHQYLQQEPIPADLPEEMEYAAYQLKLKKAYQDFIGSTPLSEKVFKVFQDAQGLKTIPLENLRTSLKSKHGRKLSGMQQT